MTSVSQFPSILLFTLNIDLIFQTYHVASELSLREFLINILLNMMRNKIDNRPFCNPFHFL